MKEAIFKNLAYLTSLVICFENEDKSDSSAQSWS